MYLHHESLVEERNVFNNKQVYFELLTYPNKSLYAIFILCIFIICVIISGIFMYIIIRNITINKAKGLWKQEDDKIINNSIISLIPLIIIVILGIIYSMICYKDYIKQHPNTDIVYWHEDSLNNILIENIMNYLRKTKRLTLFIIVVWLLINTLIIYCKFIEKHLKDPILIYGVFNLFTIIAIYIIMITQRQQLHISKYEQIKNKDAYFKQEAYKITKSNQKYSVFVYVKGEDVEIRI